MLGEKSNSSTRLNQIISYIVKHNHSYYTVLGEIALSSAAGMLYTGQINEALMHFALKHVNIHKDL